MLRKIVKPVVYIAGPEVFNTKRNDRAEMENWGEQQGCSVLHPGRHSSAIDQDKIFDSCVKDASICDVILVDCNDFRGKQMDEGTAVELGLAQRSGAILIGYKNKQEDPNDRLGKWTKKEDLSVDENGYFIEQGSDRNLMVNNALDAMFYGTREEVLKQVNDYIDKNVKGWYKHEDPQLGRKLLPPDTTEHFETIPPAMEVDLTRFTNIANHPRMTKLREIKQLGALYWSYPGATHSRYEHLVMTLKLTYQTLFHHRFTEKEKQHILAYALTHDVGHGPYSHETEEITQLDQMKAAIKMFQEESWKEAFKKDGIDLDYLVSFFDKTNKFRNIVSDKVLGADKIAYLYRDGMATGKGSNENIDMLLQHTVFQDGILGIDERGMAATREQIRQYLNSYANIYWIAETRLSQRIFTLLAQIGMETGALPDNWQELNDIWFDFFNIQAEQKGNKELRKLGGDGIVNKKYRHVASLRFPGAEVLEKPNCALVEAITEEEYAKFLRIPVKERKAVEEELCVKAGVEPLDILIAPGGNPEKLKIDDTWVFRNGSDKPVRLLRDLYPQDEPALIADAKRHAISVRFYTREETQEKVQKQIGKLVNEFKKIIS